jgi:hypothetical protein
MAGLYEEILAELRQSGFARGPARLRTSSDNEQFSSSGFITVRRNTKPL